MKFGLRRERLQTFWLDGRVFAFVFIVFPWQFLVITYSYRYNTENHVVFLQKPQKPLEVFSKRSCS